MKKMDAQTQAYLNQLTNALQKIQESKEIPFEDRGNKAIVLRLIKTNPFAFQYKFKDDVRMVRVLLKRNPNMFNAASIRLQNCLKIILIPLKKLGITATEDTLRNSRACVICSKSNTRIGLKFLRKLIV